jgi:hypothetical protein
MRIVSFIAVTAWLLPAPPLAAQAGAPAPAPTVSFARWTPAPLAGLPADTTPRRYPPTYWKEGALVGGTVSALLFGMFVAGLCANGDAGSGSCVGNTVFAVVMGGSIGGGIGALVGGLFPKPEPAIDPDATR